jgi:hypothetical protein
LRQRVGQVGKGVLFFPALNIGKDKEMASELSLIGKFVAFA